MAILYAMSLVIVLGAMGFVYAWIICEIFNIKEPLCLVIICMIIWIHLATIGFERLELL